MSPAETILLTRKDVAELLTIEECITAVEQVFRSYSEGNIVAPHVLGVHVNNGGFHIKAGTSDKLFVAKTNANFPLNTTQFGLPTIQGIIMICDAVNGRLLAVMDSIEITIIRTGAATAVAAKYLALPNAATATICGCGNQGRISIRALKTVRPLERVYAFDIDAMQVQKFSKEFKNDLEVIPITANDLGTALKQSQICITCTPSRKPIIHSTDIMPGTFIGAVGADSEEKQELSVDLFSGNKIVVDLLAQSSTIGDLHHALKHEKIRMEDIHAELGQIIAGQKRGREKPEEIIIFDSTGTALQDVAAASIVFEKAMAGDIGKRMNFSD